jgi:hypothetical protein
LCAFFSEDSADELPLASPTKSGRKNHSTRKITGVGVNASGTPAMMRLRHRFRGLFGMNVEDGGYVGADMCDDEEKG